ncbi:MAG: bis(5'-nucleosyl)-tetraphosphatase (symmetrical) YqeK [Coriobacteriaceae bacterium]|nr:bis(5'-nucleosyl)-tetraphosphatase (symmetrical) YqeK [Coriobacteriaceae bacterium]
MISDEQRAQLEHVREMLQVRMKDKPRRYEHSLGVARTCARLAQAYDVDEFEAVLAGLVHDWDKVVDDHELLTRAAQYGVNVVGSPTAAVGLLHGPVAAHELPHIFPGISDRVCQAVARHTLGALDMTPLDMVVFVADAIEPGRYGDYAERLRAFVGNAALEELFFQTFAQGLVYVISTGRYLYPTAIDIYNSYAAKR